MKIQTLNDLIKHGKTIITGRLLDYKAEQMGKSSVVEKFKIAVGEANHEFQVWCPKGTTLAEVKRPAWVDQPGVVAVAVEASVKKDGDYLRTEAKSVHAIEA